jgi:hypothetical protein
VIHRAFTYQDKPIFPSRGSIPPMTPTCDWVPLPDFAARPQVNHFVLAKRYDRSDFRYSPSGEKTGGQGDHQKEQRQRGKGGSIAWRHAKMKLDTSRVRPVVIRAAEIISGRGPRAQLQTHRITVGVPS